MSASVLGCGHACQLMDVNTVKTAPQVHLHFLTDEEEYKQLGYGKVELCCHGCGASLLMYYTESQAQRRAHLKVRDDFVKSHGKCPRVVGGHCHNWRSTFSVVDIRKSVEPHAQSWQNPPENRDKSIRSSS
jgi:hypothetical protein